MRYVASGQPWIDANFLQDFGSRLGESPVLSFSTLPNRGLATSREGRTDALNEIGS
jgi:hypothetical protein